MTISKIDTQDFTLGKGKLLFKQDGQDGYLDLGQTPEFKFSQETEFIDMFNTKEGNKQLLKKIPVSQKAKGGFSLNVPDNENLKLFCLANGLVETVQSLGDAQIIDVVAILDKWVEIGKYDLADVVVKDTAGTTTYVLGTDYEIDLKAGMIRCLSTGAITASQALKVTADYAEVNVTTIEGCTANKITGHIFFVGNPPVGKIQDFKAYINLIPEGDYSMMSDEVIKMGFTFEVLRSTSYTGLYRLINRGVIA